MDYLEQICRMILAMTVPSSSKGCFVAWVVLSDFPLSSQVFWRKYFSSAKIPSSAQTFKIALIKHLSRLKTQNFHKFPDSTSWSTLVATKTQKKQLPVFTAWPSLLPLPRRRGGDVRFARPGISGSCGWFLGIVKLIEIKYNLFSRYIRPKFSDKSRSPFWPNEAPPSQRCSMMLDDPGGAVKLILNSGPAVPRLHSTRYLSIAKLPPPKKND